METFLIVGYIIYCLASGFFCAKVADEKHYNNGLWFLGGLFFGIIALIAIVGLPRDIKFWTCPACAARNKPKDSVCDNCGKSRK